MASFSDRDSTAAHPPPGGPKSKATPLACTSCRRRKVKCDHKTPVCSNCQKYRVPCSWPGARKPVHRQRRPEYHDITQRLEKIERLARELAPLSEDASYLTSTSARGVAQPDPLIAIQAPKQSLILRCPSPEEEVDFAWAVSGERGTGKSGPSDLEWRAPSLDGTIETPGPLSAGACSMFSLDGIRSVNALVGDDTFGKIMHDLRMKWSQGRRDIGLPTRHALPSNEIITKTLSNIASRALQDTVADDLTQMPATIGPGQQGIEFAPVQGVLDLSIASDSSIGFGSNKPQLPSPPTVNEGAQPLGEQTLEPSFDLNLDLNWQTPFGYIFAS